MKGMIKIQTPKRIVKKYYKHLPDAKNKFKSFCDMERDAAKTEERHYIRLYAIKNRKMDKKLLKTLECAPLVTNFILDFNKLEVDTY